MKARKRVATFLVVIATLAAMAFGAGAAQASTTYHKIFHWSCNPTSGHTLAIDQYWRIIHYPLNDSHPDNFLLESEYLNTSPNFHADRVEAFWEGVPGSHEAAGVMFAHGGPVDGVFNVPYSITGGYPTLFGGSNHSFNIDDGDWLQLQNQIFYVWANGPSSCQDTTPTYTDY